MEAFLPSGPITTWPFSTDASFLISTSSGEAIREHAPASNWNRAKELSMAIVPAMKDFISWAFAEIPSVVRVYANQEGRVFYVRVVITDYRDRHIRRSVYEKEKEIINKFESFDFDFGVFPEDVVLGDSLELTYRR